MHGMSNASGVIPALVIVYAVFWAQAHVVPFINQFFNGGTDQ